MPTEAAPQRGGAAPRRRLQAVASHCTASGPASLREGGDALDFWIFGHPVTMSPSPPLHEAGFYVPGIRPPTVPPGTARRRLTLSADHSDDQIDALLEALDDALHTDP